MFIYMFGVSKRFLYTIETIVTQMMSKQEKNPDKNQEQNQDTNHLKDLEDGIGCTEIWEKLSEKRKQQKTNKKD